MSNPQEKAKEIYRKYADALNIRDLQTTANPFAKQCALIAVNEIIAQIEPSVSMDVISARINYYQEVKKEIELL
jgi:hypothetical protein